MSGCDAISIADKVFKSKKGIKLADVKTHTIHYGNIYNKDELVDEVLVAVMKAPSTYTREDVVEINCHGGILVTRKVLDTLLMAGARTAEPGEFTKRAFLNGRIDLSQAEAVIEVINSKNEYALKSSVNQLDGKLSEKIRQIRDIIIEDIAFIEAALDDPEHISLDNFVDKLGINVDNCVDNVENLLKTADNGRIIKDGIRTVILGKTNARDVLEEQINMGGILLNIVDTAGIRDTDDYVESIGVEKAKKYASDAELIIYVVDAARPLDENDSEIMDLIRDKKVIVLLNKSDMNTVIDKSDIQKILNCPIVNVSAKNSTGIDELEECIKKMFFEGNIQFNEEVYITNSRHKKLLSDALESLRLVKEGIDSGMSEDFLTIDMMTAYEKLGMIIGEEVQDDLADEIFSKFCMGK